MNTFNQFVLLIVGMFMILAGARMVLHPHGNIDSIVGTTLVLGALAIAYILARRKTYFTS